MNPDESQRSDFTGGLHRSTGSFELVFSPLLLALLGLWLDSAVGTTPLFVLLFALIGFAGVCVRIYYRYDAEMAEHEAQGRWVRRG